MESDVPETDPLRALFSGKRQWERLAVSVPARVRGWGGDAHDAEVLDLSAGGVRLALHDPAFYANATEGEGGFDLVGRIFADGLEVEFVESQVTVRAEIVRLTPLETSQGHVSIGCRFERALGEEEAARLGLEGTRGPTGEAAQAELPFEAVPGRAVFLLLFGGPDDVVGPRVLATVAAVGERWLDILPVPGVTVTAASVRGLDEVELRAVLRGRGRRALWEGPVRLIGSRNVTVAGEAGTGLRVSLTAGATLPRRVRRQFRRATKRSEA